LDVDYRIYVACRDGRVYLIRNGEVVPEFVYTIESKPVGMLIFDKQVIIAGMNNSLHSFYLKGKKNFQLLMPCPIVDICKLEVKRTAASSSGTGQCVIVCLANSELRLYNPKDKNLIHILKTEVIFSLLFLSQCDLGTC
jgi:Bardet-Biedl syndrome 1 protein